MYDCIIVGMGPAGMSAALYAKRSGMNTLIIDSSAPGGLLNKISIVENYLGVGSISGIDLALKMFEHVRSEEIPYKIETVTLYYHNDIDSYGKCKELNGAKWKVIYKDEKPKELSKEKPFLDECRKYLYHNAVQEIVSNCFFNMILRHN